MKRKLACCYAVAWFVTGVLMGAFTPDPIAPLVADKLQELHESYLARRRRGGDSAA